MFWASAVFFLKCFTDSSLNGVPTVQQMNTCEELGLASIMQHAAVLQSMTTGSCALVWTIVSFAPAYTIGFMVWYLASLDPYAGTVQRAGIIDCLLGELRCSITMSSSSQQDTEKGYHPQTVQPWESCEQDIVKTLSNLQPTPALFPIDTVHSDKVGVTCLHLASICLCAYRGGGGHWGSMRIVLVREKAGNVTSLVCCEWIVRQVLDIFLHPVHVDTQCMSLVAACRAPLESLRFRGRWRRLSCAW